MANASHHPLRPLLALVFAGPERVKTLGLADWDLLVRQARQAGVLARLGYLLEREALLAFVPGQALPHIESAQAAASQFVYALNLELACIRSALQNIKKPWVLLKGAAYALAGNRAAQGRMFSDIDILAARESLPEAEAALRKQGWARNELSAYDVRFYTEWMHELPPMTHVSRGASIDLHHNILPTTCKLCPDADKLLANAVQVPDKGLWLLAPEDRVLHSATHLFHEGELGHGFRDLSDLDLLLQEFSPQADFWGSLLRRAEALKQQIPLYYALRYTVMILQTPIPAEILQLSEIPMRHKFMRKLMDFLFLRALLPDHASCNDRWTGLARWALFVRSHYLRMPWYLLVPHLGRKAWLRLVGEGD